MVTSEVCVDASLGRSSTLRVPARRGDALLVISVRPRDGEALPLVWHAGCEVRRGDKWLLEKHKEIPATQEEIAAMAQWEKEMDEAERRAGLSWGQWALSWVAPNWAKSETFGFKKPVEA